jgi:MYXO-CTERM domain-containing protein
VGPALSDAEGWSAPSRYRSIRLADVDGDARADLCARHADGLRCSLSTGAGFDRTWIAPAWADAESGLAAEAGGTTVRIAGGRLAGPRDGMIRGGLSCAASGGPRSAPIASLGVLALALVLATRRRR